MTINDNSYLSFHFEVLFDFCYLSSVFFFSFFPSCFIIVCECFLNLQLSLLTCCVAFSLCVETILCFRCMPSCHWRAFLCRGRRTQRGASQTASPFPPPSPPPLSHLRLSLQHPSHPS